MRSEHRWGCSRLFVRLVPGCRFGGRCDSGVDALGGEFVDDGDWGGAGGGDGVGDLVSHCRVSDVGPREMVPAETEVVNAAAGVTVKLSLKNWIWPGWTALGFYAKDLAKGSNMTKVWADFLYAILRTIILFISLALVNTSR